MAAEIKSQIGVESELVRGSGGIFDVTVDGTKIYSKHETGEFPSESAIIDELKKLG